MEKTSFYSSIMKTSFIHLFFQYCVNVLYLVLWLLEINPTTMSSKLNYNKKISRQDLNQEEFI